MEPLDGAVLIVAADHLTVGWLGMNQTQGTHLAADAVGLCFFCGSRVDRGEIHLLLLFLLGVLVFDVLHNLRLRRLNHLALFSVLIDLGGQLRNRVVHKSRNSLGELNLLLRKGDRFVRLAFECQEQGVLQQQFFHIVCVYAITRTCSHLLLDFTRESAVSSSSDFKPSISDKSVVYF